MTEGLKEFALSDQEEGEEEKPQKSGDEAAQAVGAASNDKSENKPKVYYRPVKSSLHKKITA